MRRLSILLCALLLLSACARDKGNGDAVKMEIVPSEEPLLEHVSSVELVPIEEDEDHLLGPRLAIKLLPDGGFILADRQNLNIFRYAADGSFLNTVGSKGRGPLEYPSIHNEQVRGDSVIVFTQTGKYDVYSTTGEPLRECDIQNPGMGYYLVGDGILTYRGYQEKGSPRVLFTAGDGTQTPYLVTENAVLSLMAGWDVFSETKDGTILFIDSFSDEIHSFKDGVFAPYLVFDFGDYAIDDQFFKVKDRMEGAELLLGSSFAVIAGYQEGTRYSLVQVITQEPHAQKSTRYCGLKCPDGKWCWFCLQNAFSREDLLFLSLSGKTLYTMVLPESIDAFSACFASKIAHPEIMKKGEDAPEHFLAKIHLK